jgi:hypothetical protein
MTTPFSRKALVLLAALTLTTTALSAAPRSQATPHAARIVASGSEDFFARLWSGLIGLWTKNGCSADPDGRCLPVKNGCSLDPNGSCLPTKNGCQVDPNGRCLPAATTTTLDNGCSVDPSGRCIK